MRKSVDELFEDTLNSFLSEALEAMLGPKVRDEVYSVLGRRGISIKNVPSQFDNVVNILGETFGALGAKVIVYKAIAELHREYSQPVDFFFGGTLRDKLLTLYELVVSNHIWPRHGEMRILSLTGNRGSEMIVRQTILESKLGGLVSTGIREESARILTRPGRATTMRLGLSSDRKIGRYSAESGGCARRVVLKKKP